MNKNYTLKELADIGGLESAKHSNHQKAREAFTKAVLDAIGYEFPKDEEREVFERWSRTHHIHDMEHPDAVFAAWKAGREELRRSQMMAKEPPELVDRPLPAYGEVKTEPAWIPWEGGECPLGDGVKRWEVMFIGGHKVLTDCPPSKYYWERQSDMADIVAYRVWEG